MTLALAGLTRLSPPNSIRPSTGRVGSGFLKNTFLPARSLTTEALDRVGKEVGNAASRAPNGGGGEGGGGGAGRGAVRYDQYGAGRVAAAAANEPSSVVTKVQRHTAAAAAAAACHRPGSAIGVYRPRCRRPGKTVRHIRVTFFASVFRVRPARSGGGRPVRRFFPSIRCRGNSGRGRATGGDMEATPRMSETAGFSTDDDDDDRGKYGGAPIVCVAYDRRAPRNRNECRGRGDNSVGPKGQVLAWFLEAVLILHVLARRSAVPTDHARAPGRLLRLAPARPTRHP